MGHIRMQAASYTHVCVALAGPRPPMAAALCIQLCIKAGSDGFGDLWMQHPKLPKVFTHSFYRHMRCEPFSDVVLPKAFPRDLSERRQLRLFLVVIALIIIIIIVAAVVFVGIGIGSITLHFVVVHVLLRRLTLAPIRSNNLRLRMHQAPHHVEVAFARSQNKRRVSVTQFHIDIGLGIMHEPAHRPHLLVRDRMAQHGLSALMARLHPRPRSIDEKPHDAQPPVLGTDVQGRRSVLVRGFRVGLRLDQPFHHPEVPLLRGDVQRRRPVAHRRVHLCPGNAHEPLDDAEAAVGGGVVERGTPVGLILRLHVGLGADEPPNDVEVAVFGAPDDGG
mmetsp:Transcript_5575/g.11056  ORF Transcript_5575/g.11056 Transcript_5575/m.11056 type:complete len:334 (-) Transcript_5575:294-1295(-)